jgi:phage protein D
MFNYVTVDFPTVSIKPERVHTFTLTNSKYSHEMVDVQFRDWDVQFDSIRPGTPVSCLIKSTDSSRNFYGYVHHINARVSPGKKFTSLILIGASYKLKQARQRVFLNQTADKIIQSIAEEYGFAYYAEPHPRVYPQVTQAGHTELELMVRLAKQCGYSLRIENTEIYFQSMTTDYTNTRNSAPVFTMREKTDPLGSSIYDFRLMAGDSVQHPDSYKAAVAVGGVDPLSGKVYTTTSQTRPNAIRDRNQPEFFDYFATDVVAPGYASALSEAQAADERNRFAYRATAMVIGTPSLKADMPVYLQGIGKDYSGYWIVLSAQHQVIEETLNNFKYVTILELGSDSLGVATVWKDGVLVAEPAPIPTRTIIPNTRSTVISPDSNLTTSSMPDALDFLVPFGNTSNRPQPDTGKITFTAPLWTSDSGNLNVVAAETRRSFAAYERLVARGLL